MKKQIAIRKLELPRYEGTFRERTTSDAETANEISSTLSELGSHSDVNGWEYQFRQDRACSVIALDHIVCAEIQEILQDKKWFVLANDYYSSIYYFDEETDEETEKRRDRINGAAQKKILDKKKKLEKLERDRKALKKEISELEKS